MFAPILKTNGRGHIINTALSAGLQSAKGIAPYNGDVPSSSGKVAERFLAGSAELIRTHGLDPAEVALLVVDGIDADRVWILTHPRWIDVLAKRVEGMRCGELRQGFGG